MTEPAAHTRGWQTSEVVFGFPLLAGIALDFFKPFAIASGRLASLLVVAGIVLLLAGAACVYFARRELVLFSQPADPGKPTTAIVTTGIYGFSRNPLYLGVALIMLGLGFVLNSWWIMLMFILAIVFCHLVLIFPEERYLAGKLGDEYGAYRHTVYRWLGRKRLQ